MVIGSVGFGCILLVAVVFSAASLYALMAVAVQRRTRKIGMRLALGASLAGRRDEHVEAGESRSIARRVPASARMTDSTPPWSRWLRCEGGSASPANRG